MRDKTRKQYYQLNLEDPRSYCRDGKTCEGDCKKCRTGLLHLRLFEAIKTLAKDAQDVERYDFFVRHYKNRCPNCGSLASVPVWISGTLYANAEGMPGSDFVAHDFNCDISVGEYNNIYIGNSSRKRMVACQRCGVLYLSEGRNEGEFE